MAKDTLSGLEIPGYPNTPPVALFGWPTSLTGPTPTGAFGPIGMSEPAAASVTLTSDATNITDGDTVTLGDIVYRGKDTMLAAYDFKIGASAAASLDNLKAAVNASGTPGTEYFLGTASNPKVKATTNTDTTQLFVARVAGGLGNSIVSTTSSSHLSFGAATLTGGAYGKLYVDATITATAESTAEATAAAPSYAEGQDAPQSQDLSGNMRTRSVGSDLTNSVQAVVSAKVAASTYAPTRFANLGANATLNVKASAGNVFSLTCYNANAADRYIQLHNTATTPAGAAVPVYTFLVPATSQIVIGNDFFTAEGAHFTTGIAFAFSTTLNTYTAGTAGEQTTIVHYK